MNAQNLDKYHREIIGPADTYEREKVPLMFKPLALRFLEHISIHPGDDVLDVACGTGIIACIVAERLGSESRIVGTDVNPKMLEVARNHTPKGISIEWYEADAQDMSILGDNYFDLVLC